jgi:hypothetical protein
MGYIEHFKEPDLARSLICLISAARLKDASLNGASF